MDKIVEVVCSVVKIAPDVVGKVAEGVAGVCVAISKVICGGGS